MFKSCIFMQHSILNAILNEKLWNLNFTFHQHNPAALTQGKYMDCKAGWVDKIENHETTVLPKLFCVESWII